MEDHYIGLYYPHAEFKDDTWLKLAALYWDKLGRIVPRDYVLRDSNTVKQLKGELNFIKDFEPTGEDKQVVGDLFLQLPSEQQQKLVQLYNAKTMASKRYIFSIRRIGKTSLLKRLESADLAIPILPGDVEELDVPGELHLFRFLHPRFAFVYMEALAARMAAVRQLHPVTDNISDHILVGEYTSERLTQALLQPDNPQPHLRSTPPTDHEFEVQVATIALQSVLPRNIRDVPTEKIIRLRKRHRNELTTFQHYLHEFVTDLELLQIDDLDALKAHLEVAYEKKLKPQLEDLKKCLRSLGIDTVAGVMDMRVALPPLLTSAGEYLIQAHISPPNPIIVGGGAIAFSTFSVIRKKQEEASKLIQTVPAAYLLYTQEELSPESIVSQITRTARKMLFHV